MNLNHSRFACAHTVSLCFLPLYTALSLLFLWQSYGIILKLLSWFSGAKIDKIDNIFSLHSGIFDLTLTLYVWGGFNSGRLVNLYPWLCSVWIQYDSLLFTYNSVIYLLRPFITIVIIKPFSPDIHYATFFLLQVSISFWLFQVKL